MSDLMDANEQRYREQYERLRDLSGLNLFERQMSPTALGGYKFVTPSCMISADDVEIAIRDKMWHLRHEVDGQEYTATAENLWGAYLALIGDRLGLIVTSESKPEPDEQCRVFSSGVQCVMERSHDPLDKQHEHNFGGIGPFTPGATRRRDQCGNLHWSFEVKAP